MVLIGVKITAKGCRIIKILQEITLISTTNIGGIAMISIHTFELTLNINTKE